MDKYQPHLKKAASFGVQEGAPLPGALGTSLRGLGPQKRDCLDVAMLEGQCPASEGPILPQLSLLAQQEQDAASLHAVQVEAAPKKPFSSCSTMLAGGTGVLAPRT